MKKLCFIIVTILLMLGICGFAFGEQKEVQKPIYYEEIEIQTGDSVWSLAREYNTAATVTTKEYVEYIMAFNHMENDRILQGQHILIPVF